MTQHALRYSSMVSALAGAIVLLLALAAPARAHAVVDHSDPAPDEVVVRPPAEVRLWFSEPVDIGANGLTVIGPDGRRVDRGDARVDPRDPTLAVVSVDSGGSGTYRVLWTVISSTDGHIVGGSFTFSVGTRSEPPAATAVSGVTAWYWQALVRWLHLLALCLASGPLLIGGLLGKTHGSPLIGRRLGTLGRVGALMGCGAALGSLVLHVLAVRGGIGFPDLDTLRAALGARPGVLAATRLLLFWFVFSLYVLRPVVARVTRGATALALVGLILTTSIEAHAVTKRPVPLSVTVDALHLVAAVVWLGGLLTIALLLVGTRHRPTDPAWMRSLRRLLTRFSAIALASFELLLLTGAYQLLSALERPEQLLSTPYGRALLLKGLLVSALVLLGAVSALSVRGMWRQPLTASRAHLWHHRAVGIEAGVALVLLASVGVLTSLAPPAPSTASRDGDVSSAGGLTLARNAGPLLATLTLVPAEPGWNRVLLQLTDPTGDPVDDAGVSIMTRPLDQSGPAPSRTRLERTTRSYEGRIELFAPGRWNIEVVVDHPLIEEERATFDLVVPVPGARAVLQRADASMNRLQSVVEYSELSSGGPVVRTTAEYRAPDRMRYVVETPGRDPRTTIAVDDRRYDRNGDGPWTLSSWPGTQPFRWPAYRFAETAAEVVLLGTEEVDGVECYVVGFLDTASGARYRMWIGTGDGLIRKYEMMAVAHYMVVRFDSFNDPSIRIDVPQQAAPETSTAIPGLRAYVIGTPRRSGGWQARG